MSRGYISIVIPAYNAARTIEKCLASIFAQTNREFEIVVVDDGSTDDTARRVLDFVSRAARDFARTIKKQYSSSETAPSREVLRLVQQKNRGAQAARNRGWEEAQKQFCHPERPPQGAEGSLHHDMAGASYRYAEEISPLVRCGGLGRNDERFVLFCDADIVLRFDCLEKMVQALEEHPEAAYAYSSFKFGWKKFKLWPFDATQLRRMPYIHTTSLIRAEHFPATGWDESIRRLQDWDLWLIMLEQGQTGVWVPEVLFQVKNTKGTMSQWLPAFLYKIPKWLGIQSKAVMHYNEAVARVKEKHHLL